MAEAVGRQMSGVHAEGEHEGGVQTEGEQESGVQAEGEQEGGVQTEGEQEGGVATNTPRKVSRSEAAEEEMSGVSRMSTTETPREPGIRAAQPAGARCDD